MHIFLFFLSLIVVALGQPATIPWLGLISAACGFAIIFYVIEKIESSWNRFLVGTLWFSLVQLYQLQWFASHHFLYIYFPYIILSIAAGTQFGFLSLFIRPKIFENILGCLTIASIWTLMEWIRIYVLSGFSWNPIGLTLSGNDYARQLAAVAGIFGLSFWVMFTNSLANRSILKKSFPYLWICAVLLPYIAGFIHIAYYSSDKTEDKPLRVLLVQTGFPVEEISSPSLKPENLITSVVDQWQQIVQTIHKETFEKQIDMIVMPEFLVNFGTYPFAFPLTYVYSVFSKVCGDKCLSQLPHLTTPYAAITGTRLGPQVMVNNAYWIQSIANVFNSAVVAGLEDADDENNVRHYYNAAFLFSPQQGDYQEAFMPLPRYEKRVLVPMGEYIPFDFCKTLAARYGVASSFTPGKEAKIMHVKGVPFSPSICYEETFSDIVREGKKLGAEFLVNVTSDAWYPNSSLPLQHFEHARLRSVENGVPLIRSCNNGITGGFDCFGRILGVYGGNHPEDVEWTQGGIILEVPRKHYWTLYSQVGDLFIVVICFGLIVSYVFAQKQKKFS